MKGSTESLGWAHRDKVQLGSVMAAMLASIGAVALTTIVPPKLIGAAQLGLVAVVCVRLAPMPSLVGLVAIRAIIEAFDSTQLVKFAGVGLGPPDVVSLAFLGGSLWWLTVQGFSGNTFWKDAIALPAIGLVVISVASLGYSTAPVLGARDILKWASALCAYLLIVAAKPQIPKLKTLLYALVGGAVIPLLYGWWQLLNDIGKPNLLHGGLRIQSTFNHPNTYGFYAVTVLVAAWALRSQASGAVRTFVTVVQLNAFAAALFTLSRTAWASLAIVLLVLCRRDRRTAVFTGVAGLGILAATPRLLSRALDLFQPREGGKGNSLLGRLSIWSGEIQSFLNKPFLGHGFGYTLSSQEKASHNDYLRMLVEAGMVGFVALVTLTAMLISRSWKAAKGRTDLPLGFFGLSLAYAVQSMASNNLGKGAFQLYFWVLAGISVVWASTPPEQGRAES